MLGLTNIEIADLIIYKNSLQVSKDEVVIAKIFILTIEIFEQTLKIEVNVVIIIIKEIENFVFLYMVWAVDVDNFIHLVKNRKSSYRRNIF